MCMCVCVNVCSLGRVVKVGLIQGREECKMLLSVDMVVTSTDKENRKIVINTIQFHPCCLWKISCPHVGKLSSN